MSFDFAPTKTRLDGALVASALLAAISLVLALTAGCSGGSSDDAAALPQASVTVASTLSGAAAPSVVRTLSLVGQQPLGAPLDYVNETGLDTVYGLAADGQILLAGTAGAGSGSTVLTAETTVRVLLRSLVNAERPATNLSVIHAAVDRVMPTTTLAAKFERLYVAGTDPLRDADFVGDLKAAASGAAQSLISAQQRERPQLVPDLRPAPGPTARYPSAVVLVDDPVGLSQAGATVIVRNGTDRSFALVNASPLIWDVRITDAAGAERQKFVADGAAFHQVLAGVADELPILRDFTGGFGVELTADNFRNGAAFLKSLIDIGAPEFKPRTPPGSGDAAVLEYMQKCQQGLQALAGALLTESVKKKGPEGGIERFVGQLPGVAVAVVSACVAIPKDAEGNAIVEDLQVADLLVKKLSWVGKVYAASAAGVQGALWAKHMDKAVRVGICVSDAGVVQSCVKTIDVGRPIPPLSIGQAIYPGLFETARVRFVDSQDRPTALPASLEVTYDPPSLTQSVEFKSFGFVPGEGLSYSLLTKNVPGFGAVVLTDPATGASARLPVRVSSGRFDPPRITLKVGESVELTLKELVTDQALRAAVAGNRATVSGNDWVEFGYAVNDDVLKVRATGKASGGEGRFVLSIVGGPEIATLDVEVIPAETYWTISYEITNCTPTPLPYGWAFTSPCHAYVPGGASPSAATYMIHFDDVSNTVILDGLGRVGVELGWRSTDTLRTHRRSYDLPLGFGPTTAIWRFIEESAQSDSAGLLIAHGRLEADMVSGYFTNALTRFERGGVDVLATRGNGRWTLRRMQGRRPAAPILTSAQVWCSYDNIGSDGRPCVFAPVGP